MMPDLGQYAVEVTLAYVVSLGAIAALIGWTWARSRRTTRALAQVEARQKDKS